MCRGGSAESRGGNKERLARRAESNIQFRRMQVHFSRSLAPFQLESIHHVTFPSARQQSMRYRFDDAASSLSCTSCVELECVQAATSGGVFLETRTSPPPHPVCYVESVSSVASRERRAPARHRAICGQSWARLYCASHLGKLCVAELYLSGEGGRAGAF